MNKVVLIGHLGADPEARSLNNGGEVVTLRLATSESWKDRDGNRQERTEWHSVVIWNEGLGGIVKRFCKKGSKIYIEGQLQTRKWQDQSGNDKYTTEVVLQKFRGEVVLLDSADKDSGGGRGRQQQRSFDDDDGDFGAPQPERQTGGRPRPQPAAFDTDLDDDVPF